MGCNRNSRVLAGVLLGLMVLAGCQTGNSEQTPAIRTYEHGPLYAEDFYFLLNGFGQPRVGINPRGTDIEEVTMAWGKAPLLYGGTFINEDENFWVQAEQGPADPNNTNFRVWTAKFDKVPGIDPEADPPPKGTITEGERFDYMFRIRYRPQGSDAVEEKWSPAQSVAVAPEDGQVLLVFDPNVPNQTTTLNVGQEVTLQVRLSVESNFKRTVKLSADPNGRIEFIDDATNQPISNVAFAPHVTYRDVKVRAVSGNNPVGDTVTITGKASGWQTGTTQIVVFP